MTYAKNTTHHYAGLRASSETRISLCTYADTCASSFADLRNTYAVAIGQRNGGPTTSLTRHYAGATRPLARGTTRPYARRAVSALGATPAPYPLPLPSSLCPLPSALCPLPLCPSAYPLPSTLFLYPLLSTLCTLPLSALCPLSTFPQRPLGSQSPHDCSQT